MLHALRGSPLASPWDPPLSEMMQRHIHAVGAGVAERGFRVVAGLIRLERQGRHHDVVAQRKPLRDLQPALFALYMKTR